MSKKILLRVSVFLGLILVAGLICSASYKGSLPKGIQGAFYVQSNYSCIYLKESNVKEVPKGNAWSNYTMLLNKDSVGYDGMGGSYRGIDLLRIKSNTVSQGTELVIYLDNIKMLDKNGKAIFTWDFNDGEKHGPFTSQGNKLDGNETIQTIDGEKCFMLHAKSENKYGYNGVEIQWSLPKSPDNKFGKWDLVKNVYTLSFDYYFAAE